MLSALRLALPNKILRDWGQLCNGPTHVFNEKYGANDVKISVEKEENVTQIEISANGKDLIRVMAEPYICVPHETTAQDLTDVDMSENCTSVLPVCPSTSATPEDATPMTRCDIVIEEAPNNDTDFGISPLRKSRRKRRSVKLEGFVMSPSKKRTLKNMLDKNCEQQRQMDCAPDSTELDGQSKDPDESLPSAKRLRFESQEETPVEDEAQSTDGQEPNEKPENSQSDPPDMDNVSSHGLMEDFSVPFDPTCDSETNSNCGEENACVERIESDVSRTCETLEPSLSPARTEDKELSSGHHSTPTRKSPRKKPVEPSENIQEPELSDCGDSALSMESPEIALVSTVFETPSKSSKDETVKTKRKSPRLRLRLRKLENECSKDKATVYDNVESGDDQDPVISDEPRTRRSTRKVVTAKMTKSEGKAQKPKTCQVKKSRIRKSGKSPVSLDTPQGNLTDITTEKSLGRRLRKRRTVEPAEEQLGETVDELDSCTAGDKDYRMRAGESPLESSGEDEYTPPERKKTPWKVQLRESTKKEVSECSVSEDEADISTCVSKASHSGVDLHKQLSGNEGYCLLCGREYTHFRWRYLLKKHLMRNHLVTLDEHAKVVKSFKATTSIKHRWHYIDKFKALIAPRFLDNLRCSICYHKRKNPIRLRRHLEVEHLQHADREDILEKVKERFFPQEVKKSVKPIIVNENWKKYLGDDPDTSFIDFEMLMSLKPSDSTCLLCGKICFQRGKLSQHLVCPHRIVPGEHKAVLESNETLRERRRALVELVRISRAKMIDTCTHCVLCFCNVEGINHLLSHLADKHKDHEEYKAITTVVYKKKADLEKDGGSLDAEPQEIEQESELIGTEVQETERQPEMIEPEVEPLGKEPSATELPGTEPIESEWQAEETDLLEFSRTELQGTPDTVRTMFKPPDAESVETEPSKKSKTVLRCTDSQISELPRPELFSTEPPDTESSENELSETERQSKEPQEAEVPWTEPTGTESPDTKQTNNEMLENDSLDKEPQATELQGTEPFSAEPQATKTSENKQPEILSPGKEPLATELEGTESLSTESSDTEPPDREKPDTELQASELARLEQQQATEPLLTEPPDKELPDEEQPENVSLVTDLLGTGQQATEPLLKGATDTELTVDEKPENVSLVTEAQATELSGSGQQGTDPLLTEPQSTEPAGKDLPVKDTYFCLLCEKTFDINLKFKNHLFTVHKVNQREHAAVLDYEQDTEERAQALRDLVQHSRTLMVKSTKHCPICFVSIINSRHLRSHITTHSDHSEYSDILSKLDERIKSMQTINRDDTVNASEEEMLKCQICLEDFVSKVKIRRHIRKVHLLNWTEYEDVISLPDEEKWSRIQELKEKESESESVSQADRIQSTLSKAPQGVTCAVCDMVVSCPDYEEHLTRDHEGIENVGEIMDEMERVLANNSKYFKVTFTCPYCHMLLRSFEIRKHLRNTHGKEPDFKEKFEDIQFQMAHADVKRKSERRARRQSIKLHFLCKFCNSPFKDSSSCSTHEIYRCKDNPEKKRIYSCKICSQVGRSQEWWQKHQQQHKDKRKKYLCEQCGRSYTNKSGLQQHEARDHKERRRFECETCGKKFFGLSHYKEHLVRHTSERTNVCDICDKVFKTSKTLKRHKKTVHKDPQNTNAEASLEASHEASPETVYYCATCDWNSPYLEVMKRHRCTGNLRKHRSRNLRILKDSDAIDLTSRPRRVTKVNTDPADMTSHGQEVTQVNADTTSRPSEVTELCMDNDSRATIINNNNQSPGSNHDNTTVTKTTDIISSILPNILNISQADAPSVVEILSANQNSADCVVEILPTNQSIVDGMIEIIPANQSMEEGALVQEVYVNEQGFVVGTSGNIPSLGLEMASPTGHTIQDVTIATQDATMTTQDVTIATPSTSDKIVTINAEGDNLAATTNSMLDMPSLVWMKDSTGA